MEELREIRRRLSERLLEAERREGTWIPEMRRLARAARRDALKALRNGPVRTRK
jgi:hypothetical protein